MDGEKLIAPKAVMGLRKKVSSTGNLSNTKTKNVERSSLNLEIPRKSGSFRNLTFPNTSREKSRFAFDADIQKDFEELSIKQEIYGILKSESTFCESPFRRPKDINFFQTNVNVNFCFDQNDIDLEKSIEIIENYENNNEFIDLNQKNFPEIVEDIANLYDVDKDCKKTIG